MKVVSFLKNIDAVIVAGFLLISVFFIFFRLGAPHLTDWDEALYAGIAGDMVVQGDSATLTLQGSPWLEKEPLPFWLMAGSLRLFGFNDYAVRFPAALFSIFLTPLFYLCARYWFNRKLSAATTLFFFFSPPLWDLHALRTGNFDTMALSLFLFSFVLYVRMRDSRRWWIVALPLAFGLLTRGIMGLLPLFLIMVAEFLRVVWTGEEKQRPFKKMMALTGVSCFPWFLWHLFLWSRFGYDYVAVYWHEQFFERIVSPLQGHAGAASFYVDYWVNYLGVFFLLMVFSAIALVYHFILTKQYKDAVLLVWLAITILPLHSMKTKLSWYALPALPALWLVAATCAEQTYHQLSKRVSDKKNNFFRVIVFFLVVCFAINLLLWMRGLTAGLLLLKTHAFQHPISFAAGFFPSRSNIVLYRVGQWNHGRLLPSWYWYTRFMYEWQPFLIDKQNFEHYAARPAEFPFWLTDKQGFDELKKTLGDERVNVMQTVDYLFMVNTVMP